MTNVVPGISSGILRRPALLVLVFLTIRAVAWTLTHPVTMPEILYVARFRMPVLLQVCAAVLIGGVGLIVARLVVFVVQSLALTFLVTIDDYGVQLFFYVAMLIAAVVLSILCLSLLPRQIIVSPGHLRIKFLAYRSRILKPDDLLEPSTHRGYQVFLGRACSGAYHSCGAWSARESTCGQSREEPIPSARETQGSWSMFWADGGGSRCLRPHARRSRRISPGDPFQEVMGTSHWISSMVPDSLSEDQEPSASITLAPLPDMEEASASIAQDLLLENLGEGEAIDYGNGEMDEDEIKDLLGDSYKRDVGKSSDELEPLRNPNC